MYRRSEFVFAPSKVCCKERADSLVGSAYVQFAPTPIIGAQFLPGVTLRGLGVTLRRNFDLVVD